jgi:hypothetical protein
MILTDISWGNILPYLWDMMLILLGACKFVDKPMLETDRGFVLLWNWRFTFCVAIVGLSALRFIVKFRWWINTVLKILFFFKRRLSVVIILIFDISDVKLVAGYIGAGICEAVLAYLTAWVVLSVSIWCFLAVLLKNALSCTFFSIFISFYLLDSAEYVISVKSSRPYIFALVILLTL